VQASSLHPATTQSLFDHPGTKKTKRDLPHWELEGRIYFVTFSTRERFLLPDEQRQVVLNAFHHWNGSRLRLHVVCAMPDHVHALIEPINGHELSKVLHSIKSFAANKINESLGREGALWQVESFDRIIRDPEDYLQKWEYIRANPAKDGLVQEPRQYPWLFEDEVVKKCSLEGCPPTWIPNVLAHDVEKWAKWVLEKAKEKIGHLYPPGKDGRSVVGYLWARTAPCSNPSCQGEIPLLRSLLVCNKKEKRVALTMDVNKSKKKVTFGIVKGKNIHETDGTMQNRGNVLCPYCEQVTPVSDLRLAGLNGKMGERMVAVIVEGKDGKDYRPVEEADLFAFQKALEIDVERPNELILPEINAQDAEDDVSNSTGIRVHLYGMKTWGSLFNPRQLVAIYTFVDSFHELLETITGEFPNEDYRQALVIYLALWIDRAAVRLTTVGRWHLSGEKLEPPFDAQAIPMKWDYPEANPFTDVTGGLIGQLEWMTRFLEHERNSNPWAQVFKRDAAALPLEPKSVELVITDPPYFDAIAYADLSDFFYVWLKRTIGSVFPQIASTPLTPKEDEATALKHRHSGNLEMADNHFKRKLSHALLESRRLLKPSSLVSVMFAHQSNKAWSALIRALFEAGLNIDATWPIDTELKNRSVALGTSALESSITVVCRERIVGSAVSFKEVRKEIENVVQESVKRFWGYGFRGADLIVACYGPAVSVFGKYERVEKADGTPVGIPELLELARKAARDAIAGEFRGDNLSTLYYVWANLYGAAEQAWDDARLVVQVGGSTGFQPVEKGRGQETRPPIDAMEVARGHGIFVVDGSKCRLALLVDREKRRGLGIDPTPRLIDAVHRSMVLWKEEKRPELIRYLGERDLLEDGPFWKLGQALFEVLPRDTEDWKLINALLGERQTLRAEAKKALPEPTLFNLQR
jgi:REP element-mobilizing transposase RayT